MANNTDIEIKLPRVRGSFLDNLYEAEVGDVRTKGKHRGKTPYRWSGNFLIPKSNTVLVDAIKQGLRDTINGQWPENPPKIKADKLCLQDGDEVSYAGYADHYYISASRTAYGTGDAVPKRPYRIIGRNKVKHDDGRVAFPDTKPGDVYSGCYVNVIIRLWAQDDDDYGKRINASIEAVQFWEDGESFGGGKKVNVDDAFDEFGGDDAFDDDASGAKSAPAEVDLLA